jgi:ATP-dependent phosphoenolpyruvate carboxykinase
VPCSHQLGQMSRFLQNSIQDHEYQNLDQDDKTATLDTRSSYFIKMIMKYPVGSGGDNDSNAVDIELAYDFPRTIK